MRGGGIDGQLEMANEQRRAKAAMMSRPTPVPGGLDAQLRARAEAEARARVEAMKRQIAQQQPLGPPSESSSQTAALASQVEQLRLQSEAMARVRQQREAEERQRQQMEAMRQHAMQQQAPQQMQQMQQMHHMPVGIRVGGPPPPQQQQQPDAAMMARVRAEAIARIQQQQQQQAPQYAASQQRTAPLRAERGSGMPTTSQEDNRFGQVATTQPPGGASSFSIGGQTNAADPRDYQRRNDGVLPQHLRDAVEQMPAAGGRALAPSAFAAQRAPAPRAEGYNAVFGTETRGGVTTHVSANGDNAVPAHASQFTAGGRSTIAIGHSPDPPARDADGRFAAGRAISQQPGGRSTISLGHVFGGAMSGDAPPRSKFATRRGLPPKMDPARAAPAGGTVVSPKSRGKTSLFGNEAALAATTSKQVNAPPGGSTSIALGGFYGEKATTGGAASAPQVNAAPSMAPFAPQQRAVPAPQFQESRAGDARAAQMRLAQERQFQEQRAQFEAMQRRQVEQERAHARAAEQRRTQLEQLELQRARLRQQQPQPQPQPGAHAQLARGMAQHERSLLFERDEPTVRGAPGATKSAQDDAWLRAAQAQHDANKMIQGSGAQRAMGGRGVRGGPLAQAISFGRIADEKASAAETASRRSDGVGGCSIIGRSSTRLHAPPGGKSSFKLF